MNKGTQLNVPVPADLKTALKAEALFRGMTLQEHVTAILQDRNHTQEKWEIEEGTDV